MAYIIKESRPKAKKEYFCDACFTINANFGGIRGFAGEVSLTIAELRALIKAREAGFKIKAGETYICQYNTDGGTPFTYRAIPAVHEIALKYDCFTD
jgi:hypothetical protein